jgi:phosphoribosylformimino-5-aminoimidazole carboxamide ribonucleotide (ProFAR) isomerase
MLTSSLLKSVRIPVIVAGTIDSFDRIKKMSQLGVEGFTIGGAIFDKKFIPNGSLTDQLKAVLNETRIANG